MSIIGVEQTEEAKEAFLLSGGKLLRIEDNEDAIAEVVEAAVAIGDAFENLRVDFPLFWRKQPGKRAVRVVRRSNPE